MAQTPPTISKQHHAAPARIIPFPAATGKGTLASKPEHYTIEFKTEVLGTICTLPDLRWEAVRRFAATNELAGFTVTDHAGNECPLEEIASAFRLADAEVKNLFFADRHRRPS